MLRLDGKTIAANFSIQTGATVFSLKSGYDESLSKIAPGQILREYIVNHYSADPTVERNDLISDYQWQVQWRPVRRKVFDVYFFNRSFFGWLTYVLMKVSFALKEKRSKP